MSAQTKKVLFVSGSIGLGHVVRDVAIARELRRQIPDIEIHWLAAHPATAVLADSGERVLPESRRMDNYSVLAERCAECGFRLNVMRYALRLIVPLLKNTRPFREALLRYNYDLVIGDEAYEVWLGLMNRTLRFKVPFVLIMDFFGLDALTRSPFERMFMYQANLNFLRARSLFSKPSNTALFVGEPEDVPDEPLGFLLPNRRELAKKIFQFIGYVLPFDASEYADRSRVRAELGYGQEPLVVCSIGGTGVGGDLLKLCCEAYPWLRESIPSLKMLLVCGPRFDKRTLHIPDGVEAREFVPGLFRHFAAADLAIVQGGGTTTVELTALRRPFLYFPLEGHFEQQVHVAGQLARHQAGIRMGYGETTAASLARTVVANLGREVNYLAIPTDGARKAAQIVAKLLAN